LSENYLETENYVMVSGRGEVTVGTETHEIDTSNGAVSINIPGNVPHQTWNPNPEPFIFFYFFPEGETLKNDIEYFYPTSKQKFTIF